MEGEIVNRVAKSPLITIDLEDYYSAGERVILDLKEWLWQGLVIREKDFRQAVKDHSWSDYEGKFVAIYCSSDAVVPTWAYMLLAVHLKPYARHMVFGDLSALETSLYQDILNNLDLSRFKDQPVIIKGCSNKPVPGNAYIQLISRLEGVARSIQFGEACSSVPLYKKKK